MCSLLQPEDSAWSVNPILTYWVNQLHYYWIGNKKMTIPYEKSFKVTYYYNLKTILILNSLIFLTRLKCEGLLFQKIAVRSTSMDYLKNKNISIRRPFYIPFGIDRAILQIHWKDKDGDFVKAHVHWMFGTRDIKCCKLCGKNILIK